MKKLLAASIALLSILGILSCSEEAKTKASELITLELEKVKANYEEFSVTGGAFTQENGTITLTEAVEYTLTGYFKGQIVNSIKGSTIVLNNAYIENENLPAIYGTAKTEISAKKDSVNYVVSKGTSEEKTAAIYCKKNMELGGSGTCYVSGQILHGIKGDDIKFKGSGKYFIQGTKEGSAVNCNNFIIEAANPETPEKIVTLYLINSKNGIKADQTVKINSGKLYFNNNSTAIKTDTSADDEEGVVQEHSIALDSCEIHSVNNKEFYFTEENCYTKSQTVIFY